MLARQALLRRPRPHRVEHLGRDHDLVAAGELLDRPPEHGLAGTEAVHVGGVEEVDARFPGFADERQGRGLVQHPFAPAGVAIGHAAQAQPRDVEARGAEAYIVHGDASRLPCRVRGNGAADEPPGGKRRRAALAGARPRRPGSAQAELALELGQILGQRVHRTGELGAVGIGQLLVAREAAVRGLVAGEDGVDRGEVGVHLVDDRPGRPSAAG